MRPLLICGWILITIHILITWMLAFWRGRKVRMEDNHVSIANVTDLPSVSVIVPAWKEKGTIERCIKSLQHINYPVWEAIIMAGGEDGTYAATLINVAGDSRFSVFERGPEPKNVAINRGIQKAVHDVIVILDADSIVEPGWLIALVQPLISGSEASYGLYLPIKKTWISIHEYIVQISYHLHRTNVFPGCASVAIKRNFLTKIGLLTDIAYSWEDWDIYARIIDNGESIIPVIQAKLLSDRPATFNEFWNVNMRAFRTHLAGLWYHRLIAIKRPLWAINELFFLLYGAFLSVTCIAGIVIILLNPTQIPSFISIGILLTLWIIGRRAAIVAEVAAYTREYKWLVWTWAPAIIVLIQIPAALIALLTIWNQPSFDYKGRREENTHTSP